MARRRALGDEVVPLVRGGASAGSGGSNNSGAGNSGAGSGIAWDPARGQLDAASVSGFDAVIHLAGEPVAEGRWTEAKKRRILSSRVDGTTLLARVAAPPAVFLCASGINAYGCGCAQDGIAPRANDAVLDEGTPPGTGFLAEVCRAWEAACAPLHGVSRVVNLRIGVVLAAEGGTLGTMLPLFRLGLGGAVGGGRTYVSWIVLGDLLDAIDHLLTQRSLSGPVNIVSPEPVTNLAFTRALGAALHRPAVLPVPAFAARLIFGPMIDETVMCSLRVRPARLLADGFRFAHPELRGALVAAGL